MVTLLAKAFIASVILTGSAADLHSEVTATYVACQQYSKVLNELRQNQRLLTKTTIKVIQDSYLEAQPICYAATRGLDPVGKPATVDKARKSATAVLCSMMPSHALCLNE